MLNKINNYLYIYNLYTHKMFFDPLSSFNSAQGDQLMSDPKKYFV